MKIHFVLIASVFALFIGGCANDSMMTDEEYNAAHSGPAPGSPEPMGPVPAMSHTDAIGTGIPSH